ncbi:MAG: hypothetical protein JHD16_12650 [Solirubrobacteraceae bacterium]|nr:hypothetical protein [Solirubrobacteraceae bacterium]
MSSRSRRRAWIRAAALAVVLATPLTPTLVSAGPVVPKDAPLEVHGSGLGVARCPSTTEVDGSRLADLARQSLSDDRFAPAELSPFDYASLLPTPAVVLCDPDLVATRRPLGPFGGQTRSALTADVATGGLRAIGAPPEALGESSLQVGDRLTLPAAGPRATLDVFVRTPGGARLQRIGPVGSPAPSALSVVAGAQGPVVVLERPGASESRHTVAPRPVRRPELRASLRGRDLVMQGNVAAGTLATIVYRPGLIDAQRAVASRSGRITVEALELDRRNVALSVLLENLQRRTVWAVRCSVRWDRDARRHARPRCAPASSEQARAAVAARTAATAQRLRRSTARRAASQPLALRGLTTASNDPRARPAGALPTVPTSLTRLSPSGERAFGELVGDVNGDRVPDVYFTEYTPEYERLLRLGVRDVGGTLATASLTLDDDSFALSDAKPVPDLDGDGRAELVSQAGVIVTDAFAGGVPGSIDLRSLRPQSPRDLDLGIAADGLASSLATASEPRGAVPDVTGDGRPEPVLATIGVSAIYPSEAIAPGRRSRLALTINLAGMDDTSLDDFAVLSRLSGSLSSGLAGPDAAEADTGALLVGRTFVSLEAVSPTASTRSVRRFALRRATGDGTGGLVTMTFTATGFPRLVDYDPASGDSLVAVYAPGRCTRARPCIDRLLRIASDGTVVSTIDARRDRLSVDASFIADGPDADADVDVALWIVGSYEALSPPSWIRERTLLTSVLPSTATGQVAPQTLPVLAADGRPLRRDITQPSSVVLPDGSRWLGGMTGNPKRPSTYQTVLIAQAR